MPNYRRMRVAGGTYFFTVRLARSGSDGMLRHLDILRAAMRQEMAANPFEIVDTVILPDHLHAIWRLPAGDFDYSNRWRRIKTTVTKLVAPSGVVSASMASKGEKGWWQRRFWEHTIRGAEELQRYRAYCWFNPVKHGYVRDAAEWLPSSFHRALRRGDVAANWRDVA